MGRVQDLLRPSALLRLMESSVGAKVLVVGDLMLDEYVEGRVERVSPEAPVPVVLVGSERHSVGGAGHVALTVARFGAEVEVVGVVGRDRGGDELIASMEAARVNTSGVVRTDTRSTTRKTRVTCGSQQVLRLDREEVGPLDPPTRLELLDRLEGAAPADVIILSDYAKGLLDVAVIRQIMDLGERWGAPVLTDPKHPDLSRYRSASVLKLNRHEFGVAIQRSDDELCELDALVIEARRVREELNVGVLAVTLGAEGMVVLTDGSDPVVIAAASREVFDVTGAGDVVAGVMALGLVAELDAHTAARLANMAAGLSVRRRGAHGIEPSEILEEWFGPTVGREVTGRREVAAMVRGWRLAGKRIVFTNGCFDLFHPGHMELLRRAASFGDRLVVGVDSDASVRRLKGPGRPVVEETTRTAVLAALEVVDAVVVFDGDLLELIDDLEPDVLVKGADYRDKEIVGASLVQDRGGRIELVPLLGDYSTSSVLERIAHGAATIEVPVSDQVRP